MKKDNYSITYIAIIVFVLIFGCYYIYIAELPEIIKYSGDFKGDLEKTGQLVIVQVLSMHCSLVSLLEV